MSVVSNRRFPYDYRRISQNQRLSRALIASAQRAISRSRDLCETVQERRRLPDFLHHLAKYAAVFPEMRRYLPLTGGGDDLLQIETEERPEGLVARVSGEVDLANVDRLRDAIQPAVSNCRNVILDLSNLKYIDSTGLYVLTGAQQGLQQHNCRLVVVGAPLTIAKVMRLFGFDKLATLVSSVDEAMELLRLKPPTSTALG